ncbi:MAG: TrkH family potassium uptake protein [Proteobacteria bacterium]|nr:TrkH family potassium uptake protein [Pseudomonadota bacterium]
MRWGFLLNIIGALLFCIGLTMLFPLAFSLYYQDAGIMPLVSSLLATVFSGALLYLLTRSPEPTGPISHREGMAITALGWFAAGVFGALPFYFGSVFASPLDCLFESISGFTTTGASVLTNIEAVPKGLLFWRSLTHWLGGMGIIVLSLAILPFLGVGGMQLYKAEVPGPVVDKLRPRIKDTAMLLWKVYILFSALETLLLILGGMSLFDALCHTFGTMATGGFSTKNASIAYYQSAYIHVVITIFMLIAGINFSLHFYLLRGKPRIMWRDPEFRFFLGLFLVFFLVTTVSIYRVNYQSFGASLQYGAFQVASILTTTGYATADFEKWPPLTQCILVVCMFIGGSAGSTGGGIKCMRILLLIKHAYQELIRLIHPRAVIKVKLGTQVVPPDVMSGIWGFFLLWLGLMVISIFVVAATGVDVLTSFTSVLASIGNIGPGLGSVGPTDNYAAIPILAKWVLILCMLLGRLEIFTVIILFVPEFYRK